MSQEVQQAVAEVTQAITNLNQVFERHAEALKQAGNAEALQKWTNACHAMRDSGNIYVTWARHYARSTQPGASEEDDEGFLDEGAPIEGGFPGSPS